MFNRWRSIDSAPKDGTFLLLKGGDTSEEFGDPPWGKRPVTAFWNPEAYPLEGWCFFYCNGGWSGSYQDPTHWKYAT